MATSPDHPELQFVQASGYTKGRPDGPPLWIVIHDMEAHETPTTAENTAQYFATGAGGRSVSSHYCADNDSVVQCVKLADVAWTVGNRPGNNRGINWELAGFASQTREQWLDPFGVAMLGRCAPLMISDAARFGIPLERRSVAELKAFRPGITSHNDLRLAFGVTSHTDPGPNFPWDYLMGLLTGESDMALTAIQTKAINGDHIFLYPWNHTWSRVPKAPAGQTGVYWPLQNKLDALRIGGVEVNATYWPGPYDMADPSIVPFFGVEVKAEGDIVLTDAQLSQIAAAAEAGAEAGAPTQAELEAAAFEGAQRAEDE